MNEEMFQIFVAIAMHAAINKMPQKSTTAEIAKIAVEQAKAVRRLLERSNVEYD